MFKLTMTKPQGSEVVYQVDDGSFHKHRYARAGYPDDLTDLYHDYRRQLEAARMYGQPITLGLETGMTFTAQDLHHDMPRPTRARQPEAIDPIPGRTAQQFTQPYYGNQVQAAGQPLTLGMIDDAMQRTEWHNEATRLQANWERQQVTRAETPATEPNAIRRMYNRLVGGNNE